MRDHLTALDDSSRLFLCDRCKALTRICRRCDRGNRYCSSECAQLQRREVVREARRRYQASAKGRVLHAARQRALRRRQAEPLMPTRTAAVKVASVPLAAKGPPAVRAARLISSSLIARVPGEPTSHPASVSHCSVCTAPCSPFARYQSLTMIRHGKARRRSKPLHRFRVHTGDPGAVPEFYEFR